MEARIADKLFVYENNESGVQQLFTDINHYLKKNGSFLEALIVDGIEVLENHHDYVLSHIQDIQRIEILFKSNEQFIRELHFSISEYVTRALPELEKLATEFYQGTNAATWEKVVHLMEALGWIHQTLQFISGRAPAIKDLYAEFNLQEELVSFEQALKEKDYIFAGDIIQYDVITKLQDLQVICENALDEEVNRDALN